MKVFTVRLGDTTHGDIKRLAQKRSISIADIFREALEIYAVGVSFAEQGKRLMWEDPGSGERVEVMIPGFTRKPTFIESAITRRKRRPVRFG